MIVRIFAAHIIGLLLAAAVLPDHGFGMPKHDQPTDNWIERFGD